MWKKGQALVPTWTAFAVIRLLEEHFDALVDYDFTASTEEDLDAISRGDRQKAQWLTRFYFGKTEDQDIPAITAEAGGDANDALLGLKRLVEENLDHIDAAEINTFPLGNDENGELIVVKPGRYGPYVKRGDDTAGLPDNLPPDELDVAKAIELLDAPEGRRPDRRARRPAGVRQERSVRPLRPVGRPRQSSARAWRSRRCRSLFQTMVFEKITMDDAEKLLSLPRHLGDDPEDGTPIYANNGRYGPYVQKEKDYRNIDSEDRIFEITLDEALKIYSEPKVYKRGGGNMAAKGPLKEFGADPVSEKNVTAKEGRFGVYVTDGETNASLGKGDRIEEITPERAFELLAIRREAIIAKGGTPGKKAKATKKKAAAKKKSAAKKTAAKKKSRQEEGACEEAGRRRRRPPSRSPISTTEPSAGGSAGTPRHARHDGRYSSERVSPSAPVLRFLSSVFIAVVVVLGLAPLSADAHSGKQSYLYISVYDDGIEGRVEMPAADLGRVLGLDIPQGVGAARAAIGELTTPIIGYVSENMALSDEDGPWKLDLADSLRILPTENGPYVVLPFTVDEVLAEAPTSFTADFSVIIEADPEKDALLIIEDDWSSATFDNGSEPLLGFSTGLTEQRVELGGASTIDSMVAIRGIGSDAVRTGIDLMLIVVAVVVPAVLVPAARRTHVVSSTAMARRLGTGLLAPDRRPLDHVVAEWNRRADATGTAQRTARRSRTLRDGDLRTAVMVASGAVGPRIVGDRRGRSAPGVRSRSSTSTRRASIAAVRSRVSSRSTSASRSRSSSWWCSWLYRS